MLLDKSGHLKLADFGTCMKMNKVGMFLHSGLTSVLLKMALWMLLYVKIIEILSDLLLLLRI